MLSGRTDAHDSDGVLNDSGLWVLIVDDEAHVVEELAFNLRRRAFGVLTATSGEAAWAVLRARDDIGVAICDLRMSGLDGLALARRVAGRGEQANATEVLLISGHGTSGDDEVAREAGAFGLLCKPFLGCELRAALTAAMSRALGRRQGAGNVVKA